MESDEPRATAAHGSREIAEALGFEPDNHHNALLCPYCGDQRAKIEREVREQVARQITALADDAQATIAPWEAIPESSLDYDSAQRRLSNVQRFVAIVERCAEVAKGAET